MNLKANLPILIILIPVISALITPLAGRAVRQSVWYIAVCATSLAFLCALGLLDIVMETGRISYWFGGWEPPWGIEYVVDRLNAYVLVVVSFISVMVTLYAKKSIEAEIEADKIPVFYALYLLFTAGLLGMTITGDIFNLYVFIEISSLSIYALIAMGRRREALMASYNYLILGTVAATFIVIGIGYLYMSTGTLNMGDLRMRLPELYSSTSVRTAFAFFTVGLALKLALFPLHVWLPNAYTHAPSVVSALMAATATKVGAYVLLRMMFTVFTVEFDLEVVPVTKLLIILSSVAIVAGSVLAVAQTNIKRMLAYSSVGQVGYIVLGVALVNQLALTGSILHILNHAVMKGSLFLVAGAVVYKTGRLDIASLAGLGRKMPFTMAAFMMGALSMIGVPLTAGFVSKWYLALGAIDAGMWYLVPVILVSSLLTAIYFWRVVETIYFRGSGHDHDGKGGMDDAPSSMLVPMLVLAGMCIVLGAAAFVPVEIASQAAEALLNGEIRWK